jgi:hypothetical protein|nr:hypothetical protein [Kofleriaceae bacterium]
MRGARHTLDLLVLIYALVAASCGGGGGCGGCAGMSPIPGGFPAAKRTPNAAQMRVSSSGLAAIEANPAAIVGSLLGGNGSNISFNVPASCGGSTPVCCPGGSAQDPCGPIDIDLTLHSGDDPRLVLAPQQGANTLDVTVRARIKTATDLPVTVPVVGDCTVSVDTTKGSTPDLEIVMPIQFVQDPTVATTRIAVGSVAINRLESADVSLNGGIGCEIANLGLSFFIGTLTSALTSQIASTVQQQTCKSCPVGDECGQFASCVGGTCEEGSGSGQQCLQELGLDGQMAASALFSSFSPGTTGALDLYEVAGGYATSDNSGLALGLLGGMEPGGSARDQCGPPATEPAPATIPESTFFQGNTRPDNGSAFDLAIGIHQSQLAQFGFAGYNGGLLCLTLTHATVAELSTDTIGILAASLPKLVETASPVAVGLRPQSAPTIGLGSNTFDTGGKLVDPLLDISFKAMEIDFFAAVDDHYIRIFTVVADVDLPIGLQVTGMGQLSPVIGDATHAFTNVTVKNSEALTDDPAQLAALFPSLLSTVLPQLSGGLGSISLPSIGGLQIAVTDVTSVDNDSFLAIFADLQVAQAAVAVHARADVLNIAEPAPDVMRDPKRWASSTPPQVQLALGGDAADLEWQLRVDNGFWEPWTRDATPTLSPDAFWLSGMHHVDVRARRVGHPESMDAGVFTVDVPIGAQPANVSRKKAPDFHGQGDGAGCNCDSGGSASQGLLLVALIVLLAIPRRLLAARLRRVSRTVWVAAIALLPGCTCGNAPPCGDKTCVAGDVPVGSLGRWTSIAGDDKRVVVATYDWGNGDLVFADATDPTKLAFTAVAGVPDEAPTHDPSGYRGGIADAGPDVGAWTSIVLADHVASIAYQDRDAQALDFAQENGHGGWTTMQVDGPSGSNEQIGDYASMVVDGNHAPAIAYLAVGVDDGSGHRNTELRLARASTATPGDGDWTTSTIAAAPGSCAGLCDGADVCIAGSAAQTCTTPTTDCGSAACSDTEACVAGACVAVVPDPTVDEPPLGTGLYVSLVTLTDGRLAAAYYDETQRSLILATETGASSSMFTEQTLDGGSDGDRGMWASAAVASDGTLHIAYQDALGDQVMYVAVDPTGAAGTPEIVDDGTRTGDRPHNVGASASLVLVNDSPIVAYQDGLTADVDVSTRAAGGWTVMPLATGALLDGFFTSATTGHGAPYLAWETMTPGQVPIGTLTVQTLQ